MKNVLITGATGGIGQSLVKVFHANGYKVCATGTNVEKLNFLEKKYETCFKGIQCDLSDEVQIKKLVEESNKFYGSTNILINNAGITKDNLFLRMKDDEWNDVININLNSNYKLTKIVIKDMIKSKWGRIINISSDAAKIGNPGQSNYVASKSAIEGLTRTIANEVASRGITVNCVAPGFIKTEILDSVDKKKLSAMEEKIPLGRIGNVDEIATVVYFLSSEESSYITGQVLHVNGGLTM
jgi:3-oxoacyl-[acyl-carrier protein] reductase